MKESGFQLVKFCLLECNVSIFLPQRWLTWPTSQPCRRVILHSVLSSLHLCKTSGIFFNCVMSISEKAVLEISGSLIQLVKAAAHPMMGFQGQLEEDPEQVVTASLILGIVQRADHECPEAGLAGMGILVAPRVVLGVACVQWQGYSLFVSHALDCGLYVPLKGVPFLSPSPALHAEYTLCLLTFYPPLLFVVMPSQTSGLAVFFFFCFVSTFVTMVDKP